MLKEDRDNCTLKFRLCNVRLKPFEALRARLNRYVKRRETAATATAASVAPVLEQARKREGGEGNRQQPRIQPMMFVNVRQTTGEASTTSPSLEQEEQPRVSANTANIFKDSRSRRCTANRGQ